MAYIKLTLDHPLVDGENVTFKAPCDCTAVTGLKVYYVTLTENAETAQTKTFTFKDAHGNNLTNVSNLFTSGAYIKAILDTTNNAAYIQNADTIAYLETRFSNLKSTKVNMILTASSWSSGQYTIANDNITATCPIELLPRENGGITKDQLEALSSALIIGGTQAIGSIVLKALGDVPSIDIPITLIIRGDL